MTTDAGEVKVWDPFVPVFHWALVAGIFAAYLTAEEAETARVWLGYAVPGLVLLHVLGVAFTSFAHRENLVRAMITGRRRPLEPSGR